MVRTGQRGTDLISTIAPDRLPTAALGPVEIRALGYAPLSLIHRNQNFHQGVNQGLHPPNGPLI